MAELQPQNQQAKKKYTPEETADFFRKLHEEKLFKATQKDTKVVNTKTSEAVDTTQFIDKLDYTMAKIRMVFSTRRSKITAFQFEEITGFVGSINSLINFFLAKANKLADTPYKPPRGYADLTKMSNLPMASEELGTIIDLLTAEKDVIDKRIAAHIKSQSEAEEAKQKASTAAKKTPAKANADTGLEPVAEAA